MGVSDLANAEINFNFFSRFFENFSLAVFPEWPLVGAGRADGGLGMKG
jgi:hypothetical protein